jgi:hypothetical protein
MITKVSLFVGLLVLLCFAVGCGPSHIPVSGTVTVDGQPLTTGSISFHPVSGASNLIGNSQIDSGGKYKLMSEGQEGMQAGKYKVVVVASAPSDAKDQYSLPVSLVDKKFSDAATTPITVEVASGASPDKYNLAVTK